ncbi:Copia protein, partial [Mucuna pruriens]
MHLRTWSLCEMLERQHEIRENACILMMNEFGMSDLGLLSYFLGIEFEITKYGMQSNLAGTPIEVGIFLEKETDEELVGPTHYRKIVGCLRPDLSFNVELTSIFMQEARQSHLLAAKRILRYVQGIIGFGVLFPKGKAKAEPEFIRYFDSDWCRDKYDRKSTAWYIFFYGGVPISWFSTKEHVVTLSYYEAEYIATSETALIWLEALMKDIQLLVDNKFVIDLARHPASHGRSKYIKMRFHFLREQVNNEKLQIEHCRTKIQFADILTKTLKLERFRWLRDFIGIVCVNITLN